MPAGLAQRRCCFGHDAETNASRRHLADAFEGAHAHPRLQPNAYPCRLGMDVILQRTTRQANKVLIDDIGEGDARLRCQSVIAPEHYYQAVNGEGTQLQVGGVDRGRKDADLDQPSRDGLTISKLCRSLSSISIDGCAAIHDASRSGRNSVKVAVFTQSRMVERKALACLPSSPRICAI